MVKMVKVKDGMILPGPEMLDRKIDSIVKKASTPGSSDDVRFNITLTNVDNRRLEYLRRKSKMTKQDFIAEILLAAMDDIEWRLELTYSDSEGNLLMDPEYEKIINSSKSISSIVKDV